jgi:hypothetical protein
MNMCQQCGRTLAHHQPDCPVLKEQVKAARCIRDAALLRALALMVEADGKPLATGSDGHTFVEVEIDLRIRVPR